MPSDDQRPGLLSRLASEAAGWVRGAVRSATRFEPSLLEQRPAGGSRLDGAAGLPGGEEWRGVMDCGPGGCGGAPWAGAGGAWGAGALVTPGLDRTTIDDLCTEELMWTIVTRIVSDALRVRPTMSGKRIGEASGVLDWLDERGYWTEMGRGLTYSRMYGGGGVVCFVDDGRPADEEVDLLACRNVIGYYALPKWYLMPDGSGSSRASSAWYGQRVGRPEHYLVTPNTGFTDGGLGRRAGDDRAMSEKDVRRLISKSSGRFHRSRVIAWPNRPDMDLRLARWIAPWGGWGPGVVEACAAPYIARRNGALRLAAIMNSIVINTLEISELEHRQSNPSGGATLQQKLELIKWCLNFTSDTLPLVATDPKHKFGTMTHNVAGIDKVIAEQRRYLLDTVPEYPSIVLFGDTGGGLNGGDRSGEWQSYWNNVANFSAQRVWTAGSFGGGMRQAVLMAMACSRGPTSGQMDLSIAAEWPNQWTESAADKAKTRLQNAQARAQDALVLRLTPDALTRHDPTVREAYPSLDVDDGPLPELDPSASPGQPPGVESATVPDGAGAPEVATTPGAANTALAEEQSTGTGPSTDAPAVLPTDLVTEADARRALKCGAGTFKRWASEGLVDTYRTGGGRRYSMAQVLAAARSDAAENLRRADAALRLAVLP